MYDSVALFYALRRIEDDGEDDDADVVDDRERC